MPRTTIDLDREALEQAREALGTEGLSATVNEALRRAARAQALADFSILELEIDPPDRIEAGRRDRFDNDR